MFHAGEELSDFFILVDEAMQLHGVSYRLAAVTHARSKAPRLSLEIWNFWL